MVIFEKMFLMTKFLNKKKNRICFKKMYMTKVISLLSFFHHQNSISNCSTARRHTGTTSLYSVTTICCRFGHNDMLPMSKELYNIFLL